MAKFHRLTIAVFLLLLYLPLGVMLLTPDNQLSSFENRPLAQAPGFAALVQRPFREILTTLETYVGDQFGLRETLTTLQGTLYYEGFDKSTSASVLVGEDDWLYYAGEVSEFSIEDYRGLIRLPDDYLQAAADSLQARKDFMQTQSIRYVFVIAPDKHTIYPEYIPTRYTVLSEDRRIDQFLSYMRTHTDVDILDLRLPLMEAKQGGTQVFLQYDTHWNWTGALVSYHAILDQLRIESFDRWEAVPFVHTGDLGLLMGLRLTEATTHYDHPSPCAVEQPPPDVPDLPYWVDVRDFRCDAELQRALIFHDSFVDPMRPFLAEHFRQTVFAKARYEQDLAQPLIDFAQPDVVIEQIVERRLNSYFDYGG